MNERYALPTCRLKQVRRLSVVEFVTEKINAYFTEGPLTLPSPRSSKR